LIDTDFGKSLFSHPAVNKHLRNIFNDYGKMLHTKKSLMYVNSEGGGWLCKDALNYINYDEFVCDQSLPHFGFKSWNDWFTRSFKEGERPVDGKDDPLVIVHAA
jgi:phosphatidylserine decarboxylase